MPLSSLITDMSRSQKPICIFYSYLLGFLKGSQEREEGTHLLAGISLGMTVWKARQRPEGCPLVSSHVEATAWCSAWPAGTQTCREKSVLLPRLVYLPGRTLETWFPGDTTVRTAVQTGDEAAPNTLSPGPARASPDPLLPPAVVFLSQRWQRQGGRDSRRLREVSCEKQ